MKNENRKVVTLGLVIRGKQILLGMKKRGFGKGYWNGFGGKLHENESLMDGMRRELQEETTLLMNHGEKVAFLEFFFESGMILEGHVFRIEDFSGTPSETEEMRPVWYSFSEIPYHSMWEDDIFWLPHVLDKKNVVAQFSFSSDHKLLGKNIEIVPDKKFYEICKK